MSVAGAWLAGRRGESSRPDAYRVTLHVPAGTSGDDVLETGATVPMATARRLCCDAGLVLMTEDAAGNPLDVGRQSRTVPTPMRRALERRDTGCCRFPSCTNTRHLHAHHIHHWADGGKTCVDNLVLLCTAHHRLVHEGGFGCERIKTQIRFFTPSAAPIPPAAPSRGIAQKDTGALEREQAQLQLNADSCLPDWDGEPPDYDLALQGIADRREARAL